MTNKKTVNEYIRRYLFLAISLIIMAFGVAFSIKAALGTSPISSVPYVSSLISSLSVGTTTIIMHVAFIALQILILRRRYDLTQLMQLPVALIFGIMTDLALYVISDVTFSTYLGKWLFCIAGIILVGIGVSFEITANVVVLAGEGLMLAICRVLPIKFSTMKIVFDVSLVVSSVIASLLCLGGIEGVREGTVAAALCVGLIVKFVLRYLGPIDEFLTNGYKKSRVQVGDIKTE